MNNIDVMADTAKPIGVKRMSSNQQDSRNDRKVLTVHVDDLLSKPQVRKEFRNIESLADSLLVEGQQTPVIVSPMNDHGKYVIQKGERRWRACKHAGIPTIDIIINHNQQSELDETAGELIENIQRDDLTPLEIAQALQKFIDRNWKQVDIARRLGKSTKFVSTHLGLLKLPACVMEIYEKGLCGDTDTLNILRQLYEIDAGKCKELCKEAFERGIYRQRARDVLNDTYAFLDNLAHEGAYAHTLLPGKFRFSSTFNKYPDDESNNSAQWVPTDVDRVQVLLKVTRGPFVKRTGVLILNRTSTDGELVWLRLLPDPANLKDLSTNDTVADIQCVRACDVKILRMLAHSP